MHGSEPPFFGAPNPRVSPFPDPTTVPAINGNLTAEPAESRNFVGAFPINTPTVSDTRIDAMPPIAEPTQRQSTAKIITGPDDSFWSISKRVYGSETYYRALFLHNRGEVLRPDQLRAGVELETPPLEELRSLYPNEIPANADGA